MDRNGRWLVLEVRLPDPGSGDSGGGVGRAAETLVALGGSSVQREGRTLSTWIRAPDDLEAFLDEARERLGAGTGGQGVQLRWRWERDRDWARRWREDLAPRRVGERLVVAPTWSDVDASENDVVLRVDPGMAFGTGEHGTTRGALRLLEDAVPPGARVLDVGTGSGILAVAAARLGARLVVGIESDTGAADTARENSRANGVAARVRILSMEATRERLRLLVPPRFDVGVANILAPVLGRLLPAFRNVLTAEARLILGGLLHEERDAMRDRAGEEGWVLEAEDRDGDWWTGRFSRRPDEATESG